MQPGDQRRQGCRGDARTALGAGVERGETRGEVPLRAPNPQREGSSRIGRRPAFVSHGRGAHVVDARAGTLDDGQGGGLADGGLGAGLLPASAQSLAEAQVGERGVRLVHGGGDVGTGGGRSQHGGRGVDEGFDTHPSTLGA